MNKFDDTNSSFKSALESSGTFSPKLVDEAMKIHTAPDLKATEEKIASDYPSHRSEALNVALALMGAANSDVAKADSGLRASIYRDLAVQQQAVAASLMTDSDWIGARAMLNGRPDDPVSAQDYIGKAEALDPNNKDLKQLHTIQDQLSTQLKNVASERGIVSPLALDSMALQIAINLDINWNSAMNGSTHSAAELQRFVDRASLRKDDEVLAKVYQTLDPHVAQQLKRAADEHQVIEFK